MAAAGAGDEVERGVVLIEPRGQEGDVGPLALGAAHFRDDVGLARKHLPFGEAGFARGVGCVCARGASVMYEPSMVVLGHQGGVNVESSVLTLSASPGAVKKEKSPPSSPRKSALPPWAKLTCGSPLTGESMPGLVQLLYSSIVTPLSIQTVLQVAS